MSLELSCAAAYGATRTTLTPLPFQKESRPSSRYIWGRGVGRQARWGASAWLAAAAADGARVSQAVSSPLRARRAFENACHRPVYEFADMFAATACMGRADTVARHQAGSLPSLHPVLDQSEPCSQRRAIRAPGPGRGASLYRAGRSPFARRPRRGLPLRPCDCRPRRRTASTPPCSPAHPAPESQVLGLGTRLRWRSGAGATSGPLGSPC